MTLALARLRVHADDGLVRPPEVGQAEREVPRLSVRSRFCGRRTVRAARPEASASNLLIASWCEPSKAEKTTLPAYGRRGWGGKGHWVRMLLGYC